jgi:hypothetical protein
MRCVGILGRAELLDGNKTQGNVKENISLIIFQELMAIYQKSRRMYRCDGAFPHVYEKISKLGRK